MTNCDARKKINELVIAALVAAGLKDGVTLSAGELQNTSAVTFWRTGAIGAGMNKPTYAAYSIVGTNASIRGDNRTLLRENAIALDIFSKNTFETRQNARLLESIESALVVAGFEIVFEAEEYESATALYHLPITAFKLI